MSGAGGDGIAGAAASGHVYLVGAGPGDPALMSVRSLELIASADVILYDRLIPAQALDGARADAELVFVGKEGRGISVPQQETESLMLQHARAGRSVVRLKGGDPFVFGRGGEEALALRAAGIPFEVVPGITAGIAAGAYAGIPLTHRGSASAVALVTGHEDPEKLHDAVDWHALAAFPGTLVLYMGAGSLASITAALIEGGRPAEEPAAVVEAATLPRQRVVRAPLGELAGAVAAAAVKPPSITIVGAVAGLSEQVEWFRRGPLAGVTVAVTRARAQGSALAARLQRLGARTVQAPVIRIEPLQPAGGAPLELDRYDLVCLTSPNGVERLFELLAGQGKEARALAGRTVAAIGPGTAAALAAHGVRADVVPERFVAEALVDALAPIPLRRALVARARQAREVLPQALRARGVEVEVVALYETLAEPLGERALAQARTADYITFTSSSTVRFFLEAAGGTAELSPQTRIVSIGPVTSATLAAAGLAPHVEAEQHDIDGVVAAILGDVARRERAGGGHGGGGSP